MNRYLTNWLILTGTLMVCVGGFNLIVDPYGIFRLVDAKNFNQIKPKAGSHGAMAKAYQVLRVRPQAVILGNSRAEVGFDPEHPAWPSDARPVYNLALPGTGTNTSLTYLLHVLEAQKDSPPKHIIWGIDLMDFLTNTHGHGPTKPDKLDKRLLTLATGTPNPQRRMQQIKDYFEATFTLNALLDSVHTLHAQTNPYSENLTSLGFNPMRDYIKITAEEGAWTLFNQKNLAYKKAYASFPKEIFDTSGITSPALNNLRRVIQLCRQHNITLQLVMYPYHSDLLKIIYTTGHWQSLENWKRAVVNITEIEARANSDQPVTVWDLSLINQYTQELVPTKGDRKTKPSWYWEAGHFKNELGGLFLEQAFSQKPMAMLGVRLHADNIESVLNEQRQLAQKIGVLTN